MTAFDQAVTALYQAPFAEFVARRKQLADQLKASGDKDAATRLGKLPRPPVSAWAVNQLWWRERATFDALITAASRVKDGEREATKAHREALAQLRESALGLLQAEGNAASEGTLRRVTTTLSALAASGGFAPEPDGALGADRDPPGFEALGAFGTKVEAAPAPPAAANAGDQAAAERARAAQARRQEEEQRARRKAERERLSTALGQATRLRDAQALEAAKLRRELDEKERALSETRALIEELEAELANL
jgi:hypothetical protein